MKKVFVLLFFLLPFISIGQDFEMDDSVKLIYKSTAGSAPPHENFQFTNLSGDSLPIRWKVNTDLTFYPSQWYFALQDNETYHNPMIDSNDIVIPDSAGTMDKIIINVYHNGVAGYGELVIDLINLDSTDEVHRIKFEVDIYAAHVGIPNIEPCDISLFPNPSQDFIQLHSSLAPMTKISIFSLDGKLIRSFDGENKMDSGQIPIDDLESGFYQIHILSDSQGIISLSLLKL